MIELNVGNVRNQVKNVITGKWAYAPIELQAGLLIVTHGHSAGYLTISDDNLKALSASYHGKIAVICCFPVQVSKRLQNLGIVASVIGNWEDMTGIECTLTGIKLYSESEYRTH